MKAAESAHGQLDRPAKRVAVVGAGVSGVATAAHLRAAGVDVTVFERSPVAGGVWVFDHRLPPEPPYPSMKPSIADFTAIINSDDDGPAEKHLDLKDKGESDAAIYYAPPGPCYQGLSNNVPTTLMELTLNSWKPNTAPIVKHNVLKEYIQDTSVKSGVDPVTLYNTRVEHVSKVHNKWQVQTSTLAVDTSTKNKNQTNIWEFDTVIIATGHYHSCRVPDIEGLKEWKRAWPTLVQHSKRYRTPDEYKDKNVLLVGASVSSTDIAKELGPFAKKLYQVSRGGLFDLPTDMLPENATRVAEVASFNFSTDSQSSKSYDSQAIQGSVTLVNGEVLSNIDRVLICTGYHCSFPFLRDLHRDSIPPESADDEALVTDGTQIHNLHKDIFYIPDPTLAFVGVPYHVATFTLFEFQAIAIAAVVSGKAKLPTEQAMRDEYRRRVEEKGHGKAFHSLKGKDVEYANELLEWINEDRKAAGDQLIAGHTEKWHEAMLEFQMR